MVKAATLYIGSLLTISYRGEVSSEGARSSPQAGGLLLVSLP